MIELALGWTDVSVALLVSSSTLDELILGSLLRSMYH